MIREIFELIHTFEGIVILLLIGLSFVVGFFTGRNDIKSELNEGGEK